MGRMRMSGGSPVRMLRGDAAEALDKAHHARARAAAGGAGRQDSLRGDRFSSVTVFGVIYFQKQHMFSLCGGNLHLILGSTGRCADVWSLESNTDLKSLESG